MRQRRQREIAIADLEAGSGLAQPVDDGGGNLAAGLVSFAAMFAISKFAGKYPRLQEPALGIAMLIGMFAAAYFF